MSAGGGKHLDGRAGGAGRGTQARIFITGFMGSGKSTVGPLLATGLGYEFVDLDAVIEAKEGRTIPGIFRERGEQEFRAIELREITLLAAREKIVVAMGGGALTSPATLAALRGSGILVYLRVPVDTLFERLRGVKGRPMIANGSGGALGDDDLRARISSLLEVRERSYREADLTVDAGGQTPGETAASILASLRARPQAPGS
ncbi:MAG TPA: shikimate kinase [Bacteroidota bacterium]|nr:shikimate kinase [Bacteroidota bacterium]